MTAKTRERSIAYEKRMEEKHRLWVKSGKPNGRSKELLAGSTLRSRRKTIRGHVRPALGHVPLDKLETREHLQPFVNDIVVRFKAVHIIAVTVLFDSLSYAVDKGWLSVSPLTLRNLSLPPKRKAEVSRREGRFGMRCKTAPAAFGGMST